jgi:hypothetical protein
MLRCNGEDRVHARAEKAADFQRVSREIAM